MSRARELAGFATATNPIQDLNVGVVTAISFSGDGSSLTGIDATSIKDGGGTVRAQANTSGVVVTGILTATSLEGDGSALTGLPAGLGTAVAATGDGANIYYTNQVLDLGSSLSVDVPATAVVAYTQYPEIAVASGVDLTISDGDDFVSDILGIGTTGAPSPLAGGGGRIRADNFTDRGGSNAPTFPNGVNVTGVITATTFQGNVNGTTGTFSGDVSIGGTLTYEDVERVDATGLSTFREGLNVGSPTGVGGTFNPQGDISAGIGSFSGAISGTTGTFSAAVSGTTGTFSAAVSGTTGTFSGAITDSKGNVRSIIQNTQGSTYTLVAGDAGKHILASGTVTIPNSIFSAGDAVTIVNNTAGDLTLTASVGTLYNTADASTGDRTLATRGMATILFSSATAAYISGAGLS